MARTFRLDAACHCGAITQPVRPPGPDALANNYRATESHPKAVEICHCDSCRHATGSLCTSYYPSQRPALDWTTAFPALDPMKVPKEVHHFFCKRCGCHAFKVVPDNERATYSDLPVEDEMKARWGVATGILDLIASTVWFSDHVFVRETKDGGAACWLQETHREALRSFVGAGQNYYTGRSSEQLVLEQKAQSCPPVPVQIQLEASCLCKAVRFHITRPDPSQQSATPAAPNFLRGDLTDTAWWFCGNGTKYLAGLCACRSCRLTSGFEIQPWASVPKANIFLNSSIGQGPMPLDFDNLPPSTFTSYETSPGHARHFCQTCGATAFAHKKDKPDLVRVSVGLFDAVEGARAEMWLKWWTGRIGFQEQAELDRPPQDEYEENDIVSCFARDLAAWGAGSQ